jgi:arylsulfatase A-like enzyme
VRLPHAEAAGVEVPVPVSGVDVAPTVLEAVGLTDGAAPTDPGVGRSLLGAIRGEPLGDRAVFTEATQPGPSLEKGTGLAWLGASKPQAARLGSWKLVRAPYLGLIQLFDLKSDPFENVDLMASGALAPEARAALDELELAIGLWLRAANPRPSEFDESQASALGALGYAEALAPDDDGEEKDGD